MFFKSVSILIKTILYTILVLMFLLTTAALLIRTSPVQTKLVNYLSPKLSKKLGYLVSIDNVYLKFFDEITLKGVRVDDPNGYKMLEIASLDVDFKMKNILDTNNLNIDYIKLDHPKIKLIVDKKTGILNMDLFISRIDKLLAPKVPKKRPKNYQAPLFTIDEADIVNGIFSFDDQQITHFEDKKHFDQAHFKLEEFNVKLKDFLVVRDTISFEAIRLRGVDYASNTRVKTLSTKFLLSKNQMRFDDLTLKFNKSVLRNSLSMNFDSQKDFSHWNSKVKMHARFDSTVLYAEDLGRFVKSMYNYPGVYYLNGKLDGTVNDLKFKDFDLYFGKKSKLRGDFHFKGLPDISKTMMDLKMNKSYVDVADLTVFIGKNATKNLEKFGKISFDGVFKGTTTKFYTKGILISDLGKVDTDITMNLNENSSKSSYNGRIALNNFKLGKLFENQEMLENIEMSGKVAGTGFSMKDAVLDFDGNIHDFTYNKYRYKNIYVNGKLQKELFNGRVAVKDSNLVFDLVGEVDLRNQRDFFKLKGNLAKSNFKNLNFSTQPWQLKTEIDVAFYGKEIDQIIGRLNLSNALITLDKRSLFVDYANLLSEKNNGNRAIAFQSNFFNAYFDGNFLPSRSVKDIVQLFDEYKLYFLKDAEARDKYYASKPKLSQENYKIDYAIELKNIDPLLALFVNETTISQNTTIKGDFSIGNTSQFNFSTTLDTLIYQNYSFFNSEIELNSSKFYNNPEVLTSLIMNSKQQKINALSPTENLDIEAVWDDDHIAFTSSIKQQNANNKANLNGNLQFLEEGIQLQFKRSKLNILNKEWSLNPDNIITINGGELKSRDLILSNNDQFISLNGFVSKDPEKTLLFKSSNFNLSTISDVISLNIKGLVNGEVLLKDAYGNVTLESNLELTGFVYDDFLIGDLAGNGVYDQEKQILNLDYRLNRLGNEILTFKGAYNPKEKENSLDILATLNQTNLQIFEPFTKGIFSKLNGTASGNINISGVLSHPILEGAISFKKGTLLFDYLKSTLNFEDEIVFEPDELRIKGLKLTDDEGNKAILKGGVYYDGQNAFRMQLDADMSKFKMLNTTKKDNDLYYGVAYATGHLDLDGPLDNLSIASKLKTEKGTKLYIPLDKAQNVGDVEEIEFLELANLADTLKEKKNSVKKSSSKFQMDFDFQFTPEALGEVHFDSQTGDIMTVNGKGDIKLKIDNAGNFTMRGDYIIDKGNYTFTFQNILNKKFDIQRGSSISWAGDPMDALLNIKAVYSTNVNYLGSVIDTIGRSSDFKNNTEYTKRYPVDVIINLQERLMKPAISYDLKLKNYPQNSVFNSSVTAFENKLKTDEQSLSNQVTMLLTFGQLLSTTGGASSLDLTSNIVELASNQLSSFAQQIDKNLSLNISSVELNSEFVKNLQLKFSYNFSDRLRFTRSGGISNTSNQSNAQNLIGDIDLEYLINRDGTLRLKSFGRSVQTSFGSEVNSKSAFTSGASILYTKNFNYFFKKKPIALAPSPQNDTVK
ncbi:MAG: translocation/assembly module TamB domain-containing protein [Pseudarcicella sp.]|nr:translocation/assembly module TamB domain-containing protein [Pseudarcicella sp.]